jgi:hypothetical protein
MNTLAMVLAVIGFSICWIPGPTGSVAFLLAFAGLAIAARGMTRKDTSPSGLSMDVAAWVYGTLALSFGGAFQLRTAGVTLPSFVSSIPLPVCVAAGVAAMALAISAQLVGRCRARALMISVSLILFVICGAFLSSAILLGDAGGLRVL